MALPLTNFIHSRYKDIAYPSTDIDSQSNGYSFDQWKNISPATPVSTPTYTPFIEPRGTSLPDFDLVKGEFCSGLSTDDKPLRTTYVDLAGNTAYWYGVGSAPNLSTDSTVVVVGKFNSGGLSKQCLIGSESSSNDGQYNLFFQNNNSFSVYFGDTFKASSNSLSSSQLNDNCVDYLVVVTSVSLGIVQFYWNGESIGSSNIPTSGGGSSSGILFNGKSYDTQPFEGQSTFWQQPISELILYKTPLQGSDLDQLHEHLDDEYNKLAYEYEVSSTSHNFGNLLKDSTEPFYEVTITNTGRNTLSFTFTDTTNFYFNISSRVIGAGDSYTVRVYARTNNIGSHNENLSINESNAGNTIFNAQSVINGLYTITPNSKDFGNIGQNTPEPTQVVSIDNVSAPYQLDFTFTDSTNFYVLPSSISVGIGQTENVTVYAKTINLGSHNENLVFNESNAGNTNFNAISEISSPSGLYLPKQRELSMQIH